MWLPNPFFEMAAKVQGFGLEGPKTINLPVLLSIGSTSTQLQHSASLSTVERCSGTSKLIFESGFELLAKVRASTPLFLLCGSCTFS